jgi:transcription elongation factor Elf1
MRLYSTSGPKCPYCGHEETPDEPFYYDESTTRLECGECGKAYAVEVYHETSWTTEPKAA